MKIQFSCFLLDHSAGEENGTISHKFHVLLVQFNTTFYFTEAMPRSFLIKTLRTVESPPSVPPPNYSPPPSQPPPSPSSTSASPPHCVADRHSSAFSLVSPREARIKEAAATVRGKRTSSVVRTENLSLFFALRKTPTLALKYRRCFFIFKGRTQVG
jgi:hypothetical protein